MKATRLSELALALCIAISASSAAAQQDRVTLVERIAVAQGLAELFDQQLAQQRDATKAYAKKIFENAIAASGGQANPKEQMAFERLVSKVGGMFSGKEISAAWVAHYGKDLSLQDLQAILSYYESPIGRKDVAATRAATPAFTSWMLQEVQARSMSILGEFAAELRAARD